MVPFASTAGALPGSLRWLRGLVVRRVRRWLSAQKAILKLRTKTESTESKEAELLALDRKLRKHEAKLTQVWETLADGL